MTVQSSQYNLFLNVNLPLYTYLINYEIRISDDEIYTCKLISLRVDSGTQMFVVHN